MSGNVSGNAQRGSSSTYGSSTGQTSNTTMPIIGDQWWTGYNTFGNVLGPNGVSPGQQGNIDALAHLGSGLGNYTQAGYYGLGDLSRLFPNSEWDAPTPVSAPTVSAQTGASFMEPYRKGYTDDVVDSTLSNFDRNADRQLSGYRLRQSQAGAFGDRGLLGESQFLSDSDMNRAQTEAALRDQGFTRGASFGFQDAANNLSAQNTNAANALAAQTFNNNLTNTRQQFDVNTGFRGDENRMQAFRDLQNNVLAQNGIQAGGVNNLLSYLNLGTNTFGQQSDGTARETSESHMRNSAKSKGGGISGPLTGF
ncbi:MAG: hypothetical protein K2P94_18065 [Rhodospirillaceae bacterium]|nr:hypothetical protein [Rhodospirillaceae bacterium]